MGDTMHVLFVSEHPRTRASVERTLPDHAPLAVTSVATAADALDALSQHSIDCIAVEHAVGGETGGDGDESDSGSDRPNDASSDESDSGSDDVRVAGGRTPNESEPASENGTDGLGVLRLVRDTDPAVPVVLYEAPGAASVASDAVSLGVTDYVRHADEEDPMGALARACHDAGATYRAEQDVAMLNDLARNVYERITDGFFALDRNWRFTYVNETAAETLEVEADDVLGENIWDVFPGAVGTDFYTEYHRSMAAQEPVTFREHFQPLEKTFEVRAFPSEDGLSVHFREVVGDGDVERGDHLLELTNLLSSDLQESIDALRADLNDAQAATDDVAELEDALDSLDRMESLVNYSIRLASERPTPRGPPNE